MTTITTTRLTGHDRRMIAKARELAGLDGTAAVQERFPGWGDHLAPAYAEAFGSAQCILAELADLAERLGG